MLYISLILIASGIIFILYTLITSTRKQSVKYDSLTAPETQKNTAEDKPYSNVKPVDEMHDIDTGRDDKKIVKDQTGNEMDYVSGEEKKENEFKGAAVINDDNLADKQYDKKIIGENGSIISDVSLYEDSSNIIDYESNDSIIDPGLSEYIKIKRIGEGTIELLKDGIKLPY